MKLLKRDDLVESPFVCPICDAPLSKIQARAWNQDADGTWFAAEIEVDCTTEPDIDSDEWEEWFAGHYQTPYIDWLPLEQQILLWMRREFRFEMKD